MTIAGVGLIGGSLALVAKREGLIGKIIGFGRTEANLKTASARGMIDVASRDPAEAARGSDLLMLAVPIVTMRATLEKMIPHLAPDATITDVGSVKGWVVRELEPLVKPPMALVAAHPVAGKETTGAAAGDIDLFRGRRVIITPSSTSNDAAIGKIEQLWTATGAVVERMDPSLHDALLARASHLPQIVSSALAAALSDERVGGRLAAEFGASGLRDTTRLAGSSWEMWRDIFATNREALEAAMKLFSVTFAKFERAIAAGDIDTLEKLFDRGRRMREKMK
jgi:prephenate dehydrogenase